MGALTTAFALTDPANPAHAQYDVTIYQLGWRLGGKGASGRNRAAQYRIEEHGMHIWFGCYDNAFRLIRACYQELGRAPDAPLATWDTAFQPHGKVVLMEHHHDQWNPWIGAMPANDQVPGAGDLFLPLWEYVQRAIKLARGLFDRPPTAPAAPTLGDRALHELVDAIAQEFSFEAGDLERRIRWIIDHLGPEGSGAATEVLRLLAAVGPLEPFRRWFTQQMAPAETVAAVEYVVLPLVVKVLERFMTGFWPQITPQAPDADRRLWILANFAFANLRGALQDHLLSRGLDSINEYDYRDWLARYARDDGGLMLNSAWVLGIYDAMFAYVNGDNATPPGTPFPPNARLEAGTTMRAGIRQFLTYKGASVWKMQAGMGEVVFAPLYTVLQRRGVQFKFFHRVRSLHPSADGQQVERIVIGRQATITPAQQAQGGYDPLIPVKGVPCWPSAPRYDQLVEAPALQEAGINLEAYETTWPDVEEITLRAGVDYDAVVLGISLGALPYICPDLITARPNWKAMVDHVRTIKTHGVQIWVRPTAYELGWTPMHRPILTCFEINQLNTWGDMSHLIGQESWPAEGYPLHNAYFCGPMRDDPPLAPSPAGPRAACGHLDQAAADAVVKATALHLLHDQIGAIWPAAIAPGGGFHWDLLVDPRPVPGNGPARFVAQYWHANVMPSERYVLSVPGSSKYRLAAHDPTQLTNLYLSGDWIANGFNMGCIESATMGGLLAANALSGYPTRTDIIGLTLGAPAGATAPLPEPV
jgi:uncharacterized protein with NAD-binding domain and iron-sulfur cluster